MAVISIDEIWYRKVVASDFFDIERGPGTVQGGGGSLYINIPVSMVPDTLSFVGLSPTSYNSLPVTISARVIGEPDVIGDLEFQTKSAGRMRIANQNRQARPEGRHPAWRSDRGFPEAPNNVSREHIGAYYPESIHVFLVHGTDGEYYAGFTTGAQYPETWPNDPRLHDLFTSNTGGLIVVNPVEPIHLDPEIGQIYDAWSRGKGALLYGPPGTGKTRILSQLYALLSSPPPDAGLVLDTEDAEVPFQTGAIDLPIPTPVTVEWVTFHQDYSYESFILGMRPEFGNGQQIKLQPRLGKLLDLAYQVSVSKSAASAVIFIDEINRGNAARIFGEFITFMDIDYRDEGLNGEVNDLRLPLPLSSLNTSDGETEPVLIPSTGDVKALPNPWFFPRHIYLVASMNSVDRAAIPLDSALGRRFDRIELAPSVRRLSDELHLDWNHLLEVAKNAREPDSESWSELGPGETTVLILDRLNAYLAADLGQEFELGHGLLWNIYDEDETQMWKNLVETWEDVIIPQLEDRYAGRHEQLSKLLKVETPPEGEYAYQVRTMLGGSQLPVAGASLQPTDLRTQSSEVQRRTLRWLTR